MVFGSQNGYNKNIMLSTLIKIIPLDLAATLSPGILALTIIILGSKNHPRAHVLSLLLGSLAVGIGVSILGYLLGNSVDTDIKPTILSASIDLVFGLILTIFGLKIFFTRDVKIKVKEEQQLKIFKWLSLGFLITITNFDALLLNFTAGRIVGDAEILTIDKWALIIVNLLFFILPITLPVFLQLVMPKIAEQVLASVNHFMIQWGKYIILVMFVAFGIMFLIRGAKFFI
jgi:hypothetical protein